MGPNSKPCGSHHDHGRPSLSGLDPSCSLAAKQFSTRPSGGSRRLDFAKLHRRLHHAAVLRSSGDDGIALGCRYIHNFGHRCPVRVADRAHRHAAQKSRVDADFDPNGDTRGLVCSRLVAPPFAEDRRDQRRAAKLAGMDRHQHQRRPAQHLLSGRAYLSGWATRRHNDFPHAGGRFSHDGPHS